MFRQKVGENQAQATAVSQHSAQGGSDDESFKPSLQSSDAQYLRKRKLNMDSMFDSAVDVSHDIMETAAERLFG